MLDLPLGVDTSGHVQVDGRGDLRGERTPLLSTRVEMVVGTRGGITLLEAVGGREGGWVGGGGGLGAQIAASVSTPTGREIQKDRVCAGCRVGVNGVNR